MQDTHNLSFKFREFEGEHDAAGMQDEVAALWKEVDVTPQNIAHAPLDPIAFVGFAEHFARG
jgi:hypothetical protein